MMGKTGFKMRGFKLNAYPSYILFLIPKQALLVNKFL